MLSPRIDPSQSPLPQSHTINASRTGSFKGRIILFGKRLLVATGILLSAALLFTPFLFKGVRDYFTNAWTEKKIQPLTTRDTSQINDTAQKVLQHNPSQKELRQQHVQEEPLDLDQSDEDEQTLIKNLNVQNSSGHTPIMNLVIEVQEMILREELTEDTAKCAKNNLVKMLKANPNLALKDLKNLSFADHFLDLYHVYTNHCNYEAIGQGNNFIPLEALLSTGEEIDSFFADIIETCPDILNLALKSTISKAPPLLLGSELFMTERTSGSVPFRLLRLITSKNLLINENQTLIKNLIHSLVLLPQRDSKKINILVAQIKTLLDREQQSHLITIANQPLAEYLQNALNNFNDEKKQAVQKLINRLKEENSTPQPSK